MNKIFYNANTQYSNTGDLLIHRSILQSLSKYGDVIIDDKTVPDWYLSRLRVTGNRVLSEYTRSSSVAFMLKTCLRAPRGSKVYYVNGLGHNMSFGSRRALRTFMAAAKLMVLRMAGCRILRFGVTLGPFDKWNAIAEAAFSKAFYFYSVRDKESLALARKLNFTKTEFFPDLAWSYQIEGEPNDTKKLLGGTGKYIVLSFRANSIGVDTEHDYMEYTVSRLRMLLKNRLLASHRIVLVHQVDYDKQASEYIAKKLSPDFDVELIEERLFIEDAAAIYKNASFVISNRLHVLLLGVIAGTMPIAFMKIDKHLKVLNIFKGNDLDDLVIDSDDSQEDMNHKVNAIQENRDLHMTALSRVIEANTRQTDQILDRIFNR